MHHVEGCDRDQAQLLPARVDDYVHRDNPVRFIDASSMIWTAMKQASPGLSRKTPAVHLTIRPTC